MSTTIRHILVVDDNPSIHEDFRKIFHGIAPSDLALDAATAQLFGTEVDEKGCTYELDFASQGQEGLEMVRNAIARHQPYAMAFIDVQMPPGWDGVETMARIWEIAPDLQIVICTAYSTYCLSDIIKKVGHSDRFVVLKKPFDSIEVMQLANTFSEKWQLLLEVNERARKLEESQHRYRFLAEATPGLLWTATANGNLDYLNQRWCDYTGLTIEQGKDWGWQAVLHPDDLAQCLERWTGALREGKNFEVEYRLKRGSDGAYRWHLGRAMPMRNQHGDIIQWVGTSTDIEDQKRAENQLLVAFEDMEKRVIERTAELTRSERLLRTVLDVLPQRVFWKDREGRYLGANNQFLGDCGMKDVAGKTDYEMPWPRERAEAFRTDDRLVMETGESKLNIEERLTDAAGKTIWLSTNKVPLRESTGEIIGVLGSYLDVTQQKNEEHERQLMDLQLRQAQKMEAVGQLAAGIAHEINTPTQYVGDNTRFLKDAFESITTALRGYTDLIAAAKNNAVTPELITQAETIIAATDLEYHFEQIPAAINETLEGVERVTKIVRAMKEFSHPGGREKISADINRAIESTVTVARNEWKYVADMVLELDPNLPLVPCFISEFNQAILNLVVNASHTIGDMTHAHPGQKGKITIRTRRDGDCVEVRVSDTGMGIPEEHRQRIFEPFFTTKDVGKGTGQGLTVVYSSIVKKHDGTVAFETEVGKGTTFIIRLPIILKPAAPASGVSPVPLAEPVPEPVASP